MKASLQVGIKGSRKTQVGAGNIITLGGDRRAAVFSTPSMINLMEFAARETLSLHLDEGEESVGIDVQIKHTAATPPNNEVTAEASVTAVEKNVVTFHVLARDRWGEIGSGMHRRAIITTQRFAQRLAETKPPSRQQNVGPPQTELIICEQQGSLLRMNLNRLDKRNAINRQMSVELGQVLDWLETAAGSIRSVVVSGVGETFCAGDDISDMPADAQECRTLSLLRGELYLRITELPQIFIAAMDGAALGGGLVLAAACDFRLATQRARLGLPEISLGWPPNYGLGIIQSLIGRGHTLELALTGQPISARKAHSIGLVSRVESAARLASEARRWAEHLEQHSPDALANIKQLLSTRKRWSDHRASEYFVECLTSDKAKESMRRFAHRVTD